MKTRWSVVSALAAAALLVACAAAAAPAAKEKAPDGKALFTAQKCNSCHSIEAEKVERKASATAAASATAKKKPDLSGIGAKKDAAWLSKYISKEEKLDNKLHPSTKFKGTPEELSTLSDWLASLKTPVKGEKEASAK